MKGQPLSSPSKLLEMKWIYFFYLIDCDKDGVLKINDFYSALKRVQKFNTSQEAEREYLRCQTSKIFDRLLMECKTSRSQGIGLGSWLMLLENYKFYKDSRVMRIVGYTCLRYLFELFDNDNDGFICFVEFSQAYSTYRINLTGIKEIFQKLDNNKDGKLSRGELASGIEIFLLKESPDEMNNIFGKYDQLPMEYLEQFIGNTN